MLCGFQVHSRSSTPPICNTRSLQIWERRRRIPANIYNDPLLQIFTEFDVDKDGHLTAQEIADALKCDLPADAGAWRLQASEYSTHCHHASKLMRYTPQHRRVLELFSMFLALRVHIPASLCHAFRAFMHYAEPRFVPQCRANNVSITLEQVQRFIDKVDKNDNSTIEQGEFADLIFAMATADMYMSIDTYSEQQQTDITQ
jgi:hypothetical protein